MIDHLLVHPHDEGLQRANDLRPHHRVALLPAHADEPGADARVHRRVLRHQLDVERYELAQREHRGRSNLTLRFRY